MPEITTITSESLQAEVRRLLPSQRGFGQDLEAQNVIVPIVDLTPTAEGSALREDLQVSWSLGGVTTKSRTNSPGTSTVVNTPGFWKYNTTFSLLTDNAAGRFCTMSIADALTSVIIHSIVSSADSSGENPQELTFDGIVFLKTGESITLTTGGTDTFARVTVCPIADVNGNLINPSGFSFE